MFPESGVEHSARITAGDGGYLDLARSPDGQELWTRRYWDDGSEDINHFKLDSNGHTGLSLLFVDGVTEPRTFASPKDWPLGLRLYRDATGATREHMLYAWPFNLARMQAFNLTTHEWVPVIKASSHQAGTPETLQWMVFLEKCVEVTGPCVYFGSPSDVCGRYVKANPDPMLWIFPPKCD